MKNDVAADRGLGPQLVLDFDVFASKFKFLALAKLRIPA
jgi:hypothetical protein